MTILPGDQKKTKQASSSFSVFGINLGPRSGARDIFEKLGSGFSGASLVSLKPRVRIQVHPPCVSHVFPVTYQGSILVPVF